MAKGKHKKELATKESLTLSQVEERIESAKVKGLESVTIAQDIPYDVYIALLKRTIKIHQHQVPDTTTYFYTIFF